MVIGYIRGWVFHYVTMSLCHYFTRYRKWIEVWILASHPVVKLPKLPAEKRRRKLDWWGMDYVIAPLRKKSSSSTVLTKMVGRVGRVDMAWRSGDGRKRGIEGLRLRVSFSGTQREEANLHTGIWMTARSRRLPLPMGCQSKVRVQWSVGSPACLPRQPGDVLSSVCCPLGHHRP